MPMAPSGCPAARERGHLGMKTVVCLDPSAQRALLHDARLARAGEGEAAQIGADIGRDHVAREAAMPVAALMRVAAEVEQGKCGHAGVPVHAR